MSQQVQIVLDSDVIIHFIKGNCLSILPKILPQYKYVILSYSIRQRIIQRLIYKSTDRQSNTASEEYTNYPLETRF